MMTYEDSLFEAFKTRSIKKRFKKVGFWIVCVFSIYLVWKLYDNHHNKCNKGWYNYCFLKKYCSKWVSLLIRGVTAFTPDTDNIYGCACKKNEKRKMKIPALSTLRRNSLC